MRRNKPIRRKNGLRKRGSLKPISLKRAGEMQRYYYLRAKFLRDNPSCERCGRPSTEVHHKNYRFKGRLNVVEWWMSSCSKCHEWIHQNCKQAREDGWLMKQ